MMGTLIVKATFISKNNITKSCKLHNWVMKLSRFTFKQQILIFFQYALPYFTIYPNL